MSATLPPDFDSIDGYPVRGYERDEPVSIIREAGPVTVSWIPGVLFAVLSAGAIGLALFSWNLAGRLADVENTLQSQSVHLQGQQEIVQGLQSQVTLSQEYLRKVRTDLSQTNEYLGATQGQIRSARSIADRLVREQEDSATQLAIRLGQLQREQSASRDNMGALSSNVSSVREDVGGISHEVGATKKDVETTRTDLHRVTENLGVQSGLIARNREELADLRQRGEKDYFEFDLRKTRDPQRFGLVALVLKKTDLKRQRYTIDLIADDRRIEKKDRNANEPVLFYQEGHRLPSEIVVNRIHRDRIIGYISMPKRGADWPASQTVRLQSGP